MSIKVEMFKATRGAPRASEFSVETPYQLKVSSEREIVVQKEKTAVPLWSVEGTFEGLAPDRSRVTIGFRSVVPREMYSDLPSGSAEQRLKMAWGKAKAAVVTFPGFCGEKQTNNGVTRYHSDLFVEEYFTKMVSDPSEYKKDFGQTVVMEIWQPGAGSQATYYHNHQ